MKNRRILLFPVAAVGIAALTYALTQTSFIQETVAPIFYVFYLVIANFLQSLPQLLFWLLFVFLAGYLFLTVVLRNLNVWLASRRKGGPAPVEDQPGAVEKYTRWIEEEHLGAFFKWRLRQQMMQLSLEIIGRNRPISLSQLDKNLQENSLDLPESVLRYLRDGLEARELNRRPNNRSLLNRSGKTKIDHADFAAMLDYLEEAIKV